MIKAHKPIKTMTLEERREYSRIKQREHRDRAKADPIAYAEYKRKRAAHVQRYRARLASNPELLEAYKARKRELDRLRKASRKSPTQ